MGNADKEVLGVYHAPAGHWVGDGFPVRTLFSYDRLGKLLSPFLLLDYAGPAQFTPSDKRRGVGEHAHRGFETVTIVYSGEVSHRDSSGSGGTIGPGDVQWMTAGAGVLHEEFHSESFTRSGGLLKMAQLWVNMPARDKMNPPRYQAIASEAIPVVALPEADGQIRVIAGRFGATEGAARTWTELNVWDVTLASGACLLDVPEGHNTVVTVLGGELSLASGQALGDGDLALLGPAGNQVSLRSGSNASFLLLSGVPIDEPIVGYGPFVMNTREQIVAAFDDLQAGRFGSLG
ncbi:MAG: pirin family protein [Steroidobacteraceae bacterium]